MENIKYLLVGMLIGTIPLGIYYFSTTTTTSVLGEKVAATPSPTPTVVPTKTPKPLPTAIPTPSPIPPSEINALIDRFSGQYAVDPNVMRHIAICESGFNPLSVNGTYVGLFQFGPITWKNIRAEIGEDVNTQLRFSAEESAQTAAYALSRGKRGIWPNCAP